MPRRAPGSIGWTAGAQAGSAALTLATTVLLSRLLTPDDFGLFAATAPVIGFAQQLQALGFSSAIVQAREIGKDQLNALFALSLAFSGVLAGAVVVASPWLADLMGDARLRDAYCVAAAAIVLTSIAAQPQALLARALRFRAMAVRDLAAAAAGAAVAILLALAWRSYWALIASAVAMPMVTLLFSAAAARWRPGLPRRGSNVRALLNFGFTIWIFNQLNFAARNADSLIVGYSTSTHSLGLYNRAYSLLLFPIGRLLLPFGQIAIPSLTRAVDHRRLYRLLYWRAASLLLLIAHPLLLTVLFFPRAVITLLIGDQWLESAPLFTWFAAGALVELFATTATWLLISQGRGGDLVKVGLVNSILALASFFIGISWGIVGVAACYVIGQTLGAFPHALWRVARTGPVRGRQIAAGLAPHGLAVAAAAVLLVPVRTGGGDGAPMVVPLALVLAYAAYAAVMAATPLTRRTLRSYAAFRGGAPKDLK